MAILLHCVPVRKRESQALSHFDLLDLQKQREERSFRKKILSFNLETETKDSLEV